MSTDQQANRIAAIETAMRILTNGDLQRDVDAVDLISVAMWIYDGKDPYPPTVRSNPFPDAAEWSAEETLPGETT